MEEYEPIRLTNNKFYVYNNAEKPNPGHFIALYILNSSIFVFDSLGNNKYFPRMLNKNRYKMIYVNSKQIQSNFSSICSIYVIYFIWNIYKRVSLKKIFSVFSDDNDRNDTFMFQWYTRNKLFTKYKQVPIINTKFIYETVRQICDKSVS